MNKEADFTIGDLITLQRGFDITKNEQTEGTYPVVSSSGITSYHSEYKVKGPGVVIGRKGTLGTAFYIEEDFWPHDTSLWVKDFKNNEPYYVYCLLRSLHLERLDSGSANPTLNRNYVHQIPIKRISVDMQKNISAVIHSVERKIASNNVICTELETMAKTIYDYWFTQFDFPNENGKPYRTSGGEMVWNEQLKREIPKGWEVSGLKALGTITSGGTPKTDNEAYYTDNGIAWVTPNDLSGNEHLMYFSHGERDITSEGLKNSSAVLMPEGTVLFSSRAPIGYVAIAENKVCSNQGFKSIIPDKAYGKYFVYYTIKRCTPAITQQGVGTTFKEVSRDTMERFQIVLPPVALTMDFEKSLKATFEIRRLLEHENRELTKLRDWLLPMLMNGQAVVGE